MLAAIRNISLILIVTTILLCVWSYNATAARQVPGAVEILVYDSSGKEISTAAVTIGLPNGTTPIHFDQNVKRFVFSVPPTFSGLRCSVKASCSVKANETIHNEIGTVHIFSLQPQLIRIRTKDPIERLGQVADQGGSWATQELADIQFDLEQLSKSENVKEFAGFAPFYSPEMFAQRIRAVERGLGKSGRFRNPLLAPDSTRGLSDRFMTLLDESGVAKKASAID